MPPPEPMMTALRTAAAATRLEHVRAIRLSGPGALDLIDVLTTSRLFLRENQMLHSLMLDGLARPFADVFVCQDEDAWILLAEGPTFEALQAHVERVRHQRAPSADVRIEDLLACHQLWSVDGPFAWESTAALLGPEVLGAPYLSFLRLGEVTCFRAGKTGEYGYMLLVPAAPAPELWRRLLDVGAPLGLLEANRAALDQCALENWHFFMRALDGVEPGLALTPLELQLQWRVDPEKDFEGAEALRERRKPGAARRLTCFVAGGPVRPRDPVRLDNGTIGSVLVADRSTIRGDWVGWALIDVDLAWPGIRSFCVASAEGPVPIETRSPPLLDNRSLFVDPHRHSFRTGDAEAFPPLVPP